MKNKEQKYIWENDKEFRQVIYQLCLLNAAQGQVMIKLISQFVSASTGQEETEHLQRVLNDLGRARTLFSDQLAKIVNEQRELDDTDISQLTDLI